MAKKFNSVSLSQSKRKVLNVQRFGGLDLSSQKFNVASGRAIEGENFIVKDGILQVREGFEQLYCVSPVLFIEKQVSDDEVRDTTIIKNPVNFNGIWQFEADDGQKHIIAHIGYLLYEIENFGTKDMSFKLLRNTPYLSMSGTYNGQVTNAPILYKFKNQKTQAFVGDKKLWFLGGNKYMVIRFETEKPVIEAVENSDLVFIPTTTIGITYTNAKKTFRSQLDYPNMLTQFRRNMLITGTGKDENSVIQTPYFEYLLDSPLYVKGGTIVDGQPTTEAKKAFSKIRLFIRERGEI